MMKLKDKIIKLIRITSGMESYYQNEEIKYFLNQDYKSPIDNYIQDSYKFFTGSLFQISYRHWRVTRIREILKIFDAEWFKGKKVLELGSGLGEIGAFFAELGADVLCVEGRKENVDFANLKYRHIKNFKCVYMDLDKDFSHLGKFDLVINFGLIEVIKNINVFLNSCVKLSDKILVDTLIYDSEEDKIELHFKGDDAYKTLRENDGNINGGHITKYSSKFIEDFFVSEGFNFKRFDDEDLNTKTHKYDWKPNNHNPYKENIRRFWLFEKNE